MEASDGAYRIIRACENSFRVNVIFGSKKEISTQDNRLKVMVLQVVQGLDWKKRFPSIENHRFDTEAGSQDDHLTQLVKRLSITYIKLRMTPYGKNTPA